MTSAKKLKQIGSALLLFAAVAIAGFAVYPRLALCGFFALLAGMAVFVAGRFME